MSIENNEVMLAREFEAAQLASGLANDMGLSAEEQEQIEIRMNSECLYAKIKPTGKIRRFYFAGGGPMFMAREIRAELVSASITKDQSL